VLSFAFGISLITAVGLGLFSALRAVSVEAKSGLTDAGRSQFGAVLYRTTPRFLKLFGLRSLDELSDVAQWDPSPEDEAELRERLLRAGDARSGDN